MKLKLIPMIMENRTKSMVIVNAEKRWIPADNAITKPNGASMTIQPRTFIPVLLNMYLIIPESAKYQAVAAVRANAKNIQEKTLAIKVLESVTEWSPI
jgi:hypothetical protein